MIDSSRIPHGADDPTKVKGGNGSVKNHLDALDLETRLRVVEITADYTALDEYQLMKVDDTNGVITVTLSECESGRKIHLIKLGNNANVITIQGWPV